MQAYRRMALEHRLHATHSSKNRHRGKFPFPIRQQITLEKVGKKMLFKKPLNDWGKQGISAFRSIGRHARYFSKHVTATLIAVSAVRNDGCFPADLIIYTVCLMLVNYDGYDAGILQSPPKFPNAEFSPRG